MAELEGNRVLYGGEEGVGEVMIAKRKAEQLVNLFVPQVMWKMGQEDIMQRAKQCALIAVNEILEDRKEVDGMRVINDPYWLDVKQELEKL